MALASLLRDGKIQAAESAQPINPLAPKPAHFASRAKSVIYLFMAGGPSQLDLFEHKPKLVELSGKPIPESFLKGKRFAFMDSFSREVPKLLGSGRQFQRYGKSGRYVSECLPHLGRVVDDLAYPRSTPTASITLLQRFSQYRLDAFWPAQHGCVGDLRHRQ
jgi:hypothetical protein